MQFEGRAVNKMVDLGLGMIFLFINILFFT